MTNRWRGPFRWHRWVLVVVCGSVAAVGGAVTASAAPVPVTARPAPTFNGQVFAAAYSGTTIYLGGDFTSASWNGQSITRNHLAALDAVSGALLSWAPSADGRVRALTVLDGVVYCGGSFTHVGGLARTRLAAIDASTAAVTSFNHSANAEPRAITSGSGVVYVGGLFTTIDGVSRTRLAAFDASGLSSTWHPAADGEVDSLFATTDGVYAGGFFTHVNGAAAARLAELDAVDGHVLPAFHASAPYNVKAVWADDTGVYAALGGPGGRAMAFDSSGTARWTITTDGDTQAIAEMDGDVYVGGHFSNVCKTSATGNQGVCLDGRTNVGRTFAVDLNGVLEGWRPEVRGGVVGVHVILAMVALHEIAFGGDWSTVGGVSRPDFALFG